MFDVLYFRFDKLHVKNYAISISTKFAKVIMGPLNCRLELMLIDCQILTYSKYEYKWYAVRLDVMHIKSFCC